MATRLGPFWFGDSVGPDEDAAAQPIHAAMLAHILTGRGQMTSIQPSGPAPSSYEERGEGGLARSSPTRRARLADGPMSDALAPARLPQPPLRHDATRDSAPQRSRYIASLLKEKQERMRLSSTFQPERARYGLANRVQKAAERTGVVDIGARKGDPSLAQFEGVRTTGASSVHVKPR